MLAWAAEPGLLPRWRWLLLLLLLGCSQVCCIQLLCWGLRLLLMLLQAGYGQPRHQLHMQVKWERCGCMFMSLLKLHQKVTQRLGGAFQLHA
jgi:hypothetical protein